MSTTITDFVFDMDDTLVNTNGYILNKLRNHLIKTKDTKYLEIVDETIKYGKSSLLFENELRDLVFKVCIEDGGFSLLASPSKLVNNDLLAFFKRATDIGKHIHICTHRGFLKNGKYNTDSWLHAYHLDGYITDVHVLNSAEHPDKTKFLSKHYGDNYLLVDDNPLHNPGEHHQANRNLVVYTGINQLDAYAYNLRTDNPIDFLNKCLEV